MTSVLRDWVMELPLREQGALLTAIRGCDLTPKEPLDSIEREMVAFIRYLVMNPADPREVGIEPGTFMVSARRQDRSFKLSRIGHYPHHFVLHLVHAIQIIAVRHPDPKVQSEMRAVYNLAVFDMHFNVETDEQMIRRLSEDRIANGNIVS